MIHFKTQEHPFFDELKRKVDEYFESTGQARTGNWKIFLKAGILIGLLFGLYITLVFFTPGVWVSIGLCTMLGLTLAAVGFNVMHDSAHGSFSEYKWLNNVMGHSLNLMGGDVHLWKTKHNLIHHTFTNIDGLDDDIDIAPVLRISENQKLLWIHRFQHVYAFIFYALNYLFWVFYFDYKKYFSKKIGATPIRKYTPWQHVIFWVTKVFYIMTFVVLPMFFVGVVNTLVGYAIVTLSCGIVIAIVFQLAHVVGEASFHHADDKDELKQVEWAVHQINTTSNFAMHSRWVNWFTGGLNHQVEHHLFPRISHVHYPALSSIVQNTCEKFGIRYNSHRTVYSALRAHVVHLRDIGRG